MSEPEIFHEDRGGHWQVALRLDGEVVSRVGVVKKRMRIGQAVVRMGGIAGVWTHEKHRLKGYASRCMEASIALLEAEGYEMSLLFGIADFYHRFGYGVVFPDPVLHVRTENLLRARRRDPVRAMRRADGPEVARIYARCNARRTGTTLRPKDWPYFERSPHFKKPGRAVLVLDGRGRTVGYATYAFLDERLRVSEVGARNPSAFETLTAVLGRQARRRGVEEVEFHLPMDDPFGEFCVHLGCRWSIVHPRNRGPMGRILHLNPLMKALQPELSRRLRTSPTPWAGRLRMETDLGIVGLQLAGNGVTLAPAHPEAVRVRLPQMALTQVVMGYRSVADVALDPGVSIPHRALPALNALFPKGHPYMWWSDRF